MIYLIRSTWYDFATSNIIDLVKIGFTENFDKRWEAYKLHNPLCKIINTIEDGTEDDEKRIHYHFKDLTYPDYGREWFKYDQSIVEFFNVHRTSESLNSMPIKEEKEILLADDVVLKDWVDKNKEAFSEGVRKWLDSYFKEKQFAKKIRSFCEASSYLTEEDKDFLLNKLPIELPFKNYYQTLGPSRCKAVGYTKGELEKELELLKFNKGDIKRELDFVFKVGEVYLLSDIKDKLRTIYNTLGFTKTPKATDLREYYELKACRKTISGKQQEAFKIIKKL